MQKEVYEFISKKTNDPIIKRRTCRVSGEEFAIFESDKKFYDKISPTFDGQRFQIPFPTLCPTERERRRMIWRNIHKYYKRICDQTWKYIVSMYAPESQYENIYSLDVWRWDDRDPLDFWVSYTSNKFLFKQFHQLATKMPQLAIINDDGVNSENCAYCCDFSYGKNSYLTTGSWRTEYCMYSDNANDAERVVDSISTNNSKHSYECIACDWLFTCFFLINSFDCNFCRYGFDLQWCNDCLGCIWLRNEQHCIFNIKYKEEEYQKKINAIVKEWRESFVDEWELFCDTYQYKSLYNLKSVDSIWDNLVNTKNMISCFDIFGGKECKYFFAGDTPIFSQDIIQSGKCELCYDSITPDESFGCAFTLRCWKCTKVFYSDNCHGCQDCFFCSWLRNQQYCIFNKQYTKQEYEKEVAKIIVHMQETWERGEFFDPALSPFGYNETVAQEYYPLTRDQALARWYKRQDKEYPINIPEWIEKVESHEVNTFYLSEDWTTRDPSLHSGWRITIDDSILKKALICEVSGKPFRIIKPELEFYQKHKLPLPTKHPDIRHQERLAKRPGRELYLRTCDKTWEEILSVYPQDTPFEVYSESAYRKEVYW